MVVKTENALGLKDKRITIKPELVEIKAEIAFISIKNICLEVSFIKSSNQFNLLREQMKE